MPTRLEGPPGSAVGDVVHAPAGPAIAAASGSAECDGGIAYVHAGRQPIHVAVARRYDVETGGQSRWSGVIVVILRGAKEPKPEHGFRIVSPRDGDVYRLMPGVDVRYATVALRAAGGRGDGLTRWTVDDVAHGGTRWTLLPGRHRVRAVSASGDSAEVTVRVE